MRARVAMVLAVGLLVAADKKGDADKALKPLQGEWKLVSMEANGNMAPDQVVENIRATVKGKKVTIKQGMRSSEATLTLNPGKDPKWMDAAGKQEGREIKTIGIYELKADTLKVCYTLAGNPRPKEFSTKGGTNERPLVLTVYKRVKDK